MLSKLAEKADALSLDKYIIRLLSAWCLTAVFFNIGSGADFEELSAYSGIGIGLFAVVFVLVFAVISLFGFLSEKKEKRFDLLEDELATLMKEMPGYKTISVEVQIVQRSFSLIGMQSGRYPITKEKLTIFEALAMAGDIGDYGDKAQLKLIREKNGTTIVKTFDVRSKDIINSEFYYIEPNDIIYIRRFNGYSFGMNNVGAVISVTAATISFGVFIYTIVQTGINHVKKYGKKGGEK